MIKRYGALLAVAVLFIAGDALACRSHIGYPTTDRDTTTYKNNLNLELSDYGVIYEEAAPWSSCTQAAADALYKKLYTTFNPSLVGQPGFPRTSDQITGTYNQFQGWLAGGDVALIQATALRLANVGKLSKPLDDLVQRVSNIYQFRVDKNCGFDGTVPDYSNPSNPPIVRWTTQNSCMEDYTIGAMGLAWTAAYRYKRGLGNYTTPAANARTAITNSLSTNSSVCAWSGQTTISPSPARGPCTGNIANLRDNNYVPVSMHAGDSMPYGMGLFTSIAAATVALEVMGQPVTLSSDEQLVVQKLYNHGRANTYPDHSDFKSTCYQFALVNGEMRATTPSYCGDNNSRYLPKMFPVRDFVARYAPPSASSPGFDTFDPNLFCDTSVGNSPLGPDSCFFYNSGRRAVYGHMGQAWVQNPPIFSSTGLGDYTVTLRTYNGNYLSAVSGGGAGVNAVPTTPGSYEQFSLMNRTDTTLSDGDTVTLQTMHYNKGHWFVAENGGGPGSVLNANRIYPWSWETFTIHKLNGTGNINSGDTVALKSILGYYVSATNGGGSSVLVDKTAAITWEAFTINLTHN